MDQIVVVGRVVVIVVDEDAAGNVVVDVIVLKFYKLLKDLVF